MKELRYLLILFLPLLLIACSDKDDDPDFIKVDVELDIVNKGTKVVFNVSVSNIDPQLITDCYVLWDAVASDSLWRFSVWDVEVWKDSGMTVNGLDIKRLSSNGGKLTYEFEVFPWVDVPRSEKDAYKAGVIAQAFIMINRRTQRRNLLPKMVEVECSIKPEILFKETRLDGRDMIVKANIDAPGSVEIKGRGVCWYTDSFTPIEDYYWIEAGDGAGEFEVRIEEGAMQNYIYCIAYATTSMGTTFSTDEFFFQKGGDIEVSISEDYENLTYESVTVSGFCNVDNELLFPITERGFCYRRVGDKPSRLPTTSDHTVKIEPGTGDFKATITGLL